MTESLYFVCYPFHIYNEPLGFLPWNPNSNCHKSSFSNILPVKFHHIHFYFSWKVLTIVKVPLRKNILIASVWWTTCHGHPTCFISINDFQLTKDTSPNELKLVQNWPNHLYTKVLRTVLPPLSYAKIISLVSKQKLWSTGDPQIWRIFGFQEPYFDLKAKVHK